MKFKKGYGHGSGFVLRCRFFTLILHWHKKKDWARNKHKAK